METRPTVKKKGGKNTEGNKDRKEETEKYLTLCEFLIPTLPIDLPVLYSTHLVVGQRWVGLRYYTLS